jgi:flavin reductase (DIM6/NTAB) family NADH-FMN oxidoreductase RutF
MSDVSDVFDELVGELDYPMLVVTAAASNEVAGCLVGFATQASISPPLFVVCLSARNRTSRIASRAGYLGVHLLPSHAEGLAELFGGETGDDVDKFARVRWSPGPGGTPLLEDSPNRFVGEILARHRWGDHLSVLLEPVLAEHPEPVRAFPFRRAKDIDPGHDA